MTGSDDAKESASLSSDVVRTIAALNGVRLEPTRVAGHAQALRELRASAPWEQERLGFRFHDGAFDFVRPAHVFGQRASQGDEAPEQP